MHQDKDAPFLKIKLQKVLSKTRTNPEWVYLQDFLSLHANGLSLLSLLPPKNIF